MKKLRQKIWSALYRLGLTNLLSDGLFVKALFWFRLGRRLNLRSPQGFNEKIQWMKLYYRNPLLVQCADKYAVREFVAKKIGKKYLVPIIGVYDNVNQIRWDELPLRFVLKATHGSGWNLICKDRLEFDCRSAERKLKKWLVSDFSRVGREWQYAEIKPRIVCETYIEDDDGGRLKDYKVFTFNGKCKYIWVDYYKRDEKGHYVHLRNIYDCNWNWMPNTGSLFPCGRADDVACPECLAELLEVSSRLGEGFPHCRVDFYILNNRRLLFGELTFSCGNGVNEFFPRTFEGELGKEFNLHVN